MSDFPKKSDPWGLIADYILKEESKLREGNDELPESAPFTKWGVDLAKIIGISKNAFWRYRRAGLLYNEGVDKFSDIKLSKLASLSDVNHENLNELQKIWRVAPPEMYKDLFKRVVINKDITRKELRSIWASLRPALGGETARGRRKGKAFEIRISGEDKNAQSHMINGLVMVELKKQLKTLFKDNSSSPTLIDCREQYRPGPSEMVDALVLCCNDERGFEVETNGISFNLQRAREELPQIDAGEMPLLPCDMLWLVYLHSAYQDFKDIKNLIPVYIGIIGAEKDSEKDAVSILRIIRPAKPNRINHLREHTINIMAAAYKIKSQY